MFAVVIRDGVVPASDLSLRMSVIVSVVERFGGALFFVLMP